MGSRYHVYRGEFDLAMRLDEELLRLSGQRNDSGGLVLGHQACGSQAIAGRFVLSRSHLEAALALYDPNSHRSLTFQTGTTPGWYLRGYWGSFFSASAFRTRH